MFNRITSAPAILGDKPIGGTRISVAMILEWVASLAVRDDIVRTAFPQGAPSATLGCGI